MSSALPPQPAQAPLTLGAPPPGTHLPNASPPSPPHPQDLTPRASPPNASTSEPRPQCLARNASPPNAPPPMPHPSGPHLFDSAELGLEARPACLEGKPRHRPPLPPLAPPSEPAVPSVLAVSGRLARGPAPGGGTALGGPGRKELEGKADELKTEGG